jgi:hypothetical protein
MTLPIPFPAHTMEGNLHKPLNVINEAENLNVQKPQKNVQLISKKCLMVHVHSETKRGGLSYFNQR